MADVVVAPGNRWMFRNEAQLRVSDTEATSIMDRPLCSAAPFTDRIENGGAAYGSGNPGKRVRGVRKTLYEVHRTRGLDGYLAFALLDGARLRWAIRDGSAVADRRLADFFPARGLPPFS